MVRRPMMYVTVFFAAAILITYYFGAWKAFLPAVLSAFVFFVNVNDTRLSIKKTTVIMILISYLSGMLIYVIDDSKCSSLQITDDQVDMVCRVYQTERRQYTGIDGKNKEYISIKAFVQTLEGEQVDNKEKVLIKYYPEYEISPEACEEQLNDSIIPGRLIAFSGSVSVPEGRRNPGCFDYAIYLKSLGINKIVTAKQIYEYGESENIPALKKQTLASIEKLFIYKEKIISNIETYNGAETAALIRAIMFGEKTELEDDLLREFRMNGTAHVLAVSGLHIGVIYRFISGLWKLPKRKVYFTVIVTFFTAYAILASFSPSVVRAVIMVWLHLYADMTNRRYDMSSSAFFTAIIMLICNPMHIFNAGFQMSFLAVLVLSLLIPIIKKIHKGVFLGSLSIQIGLLPYTIYNFNYFSVAAVFINVPIIFLTGLIVPIGICCMAAMFVSEHVFVLASTLVGLLCDTMKMINGFTVIEGATVFNVCSPGIGMVALYYLILLVFISEEGRLLFIRKRKKTIVVLMIAVVTVAAVFGLNAGNRFKDSEIIFVDVGQGDCIHFRAGKQNDYLIDGGGSITYEVGTKTLKPYLLKNGARHVDGAFVTHLHTDHYKGVTELCREGMVKKLFVYEGYKIKEDEIVKDTGLDREDIIYIHSGQSVNLENDVTVEVLWPDKPADNYYKNVEFNEKDENSFSLIMKINIKGRSVLVTADADTQCLDDLASGYGEKLDADILKAAHHGSKYSDSEAFIAAVKPEYAVFQVGKNNFGHPDQGVVENFRKKGIMIYRNDLNGAVGFDIDKNGVIKTRTVKGE